MPYHRTHFMVSSYAPLVSSEKAYHNKMSVEDITKAWFDKSWMMIRIDDENMKCMASCLLYRGDVVPKEVYYALKV